jgi:hypothetical protein
MKNHSMKRGTLVPSDGCSEDQCSLPRGMPCYMTRLEDDYLRTPRGRRWWPHHEGGTHYGGACDVCGRFTSERDTFVSLVDRGPRCGWCYEIEQNQLSKSPERREP